MEGAAHLFSPSTRRRPCHLLPQNPVAYFGISALISKRGQSKASLTFLTPRLLSRPCIVRRVSFHIVAQHLVHRRLVLRRGLLEPGDHVGIEPDRHRLLDGAVEAADLGLAPVRDLGNIAGVDRRIRHLLECRQLLPLTRAHRTACAPPLWLYAPR